MADTERVGAALKRWRGERRQEDVAAALGVSQSTISGIEKTGRCSSVLLLALVKLYQPPPEELAEVLLARGSDDDVPAAMGA